MKSKVNPVVEHIASCPGPLRRGTRKGLVHTVSACANIYQNLSILCHCINKPHVGKVKLHHISTCKLVL